jgi:hypothetical protein
MPTERQIQRTRQALSMGVSVADVRATLLAEGLTEYQVFLCVKAAEILLG